MPALLRFPILFVVAFLFAHPALTQIIGGRGNGQNAPAEVKASEVSAGGFSGNVSLFTGTYNSSYNLGTVTEPSGLSFTATMTYSSAFSAGDNQPFVSGVPYGEGWNVDIPTISVTTEDFSKYTKLQLESINSANSAPFTPSFSANEQQREGDIFWFSPSLNIPGVASGRLVYKYMEASDRVFVLHEFERYVEARMIDGGYTWEVILDDGTRYEFRKAMINVSNAPNQRVPTLNLAGPEGRSLALPKTSFVKWVCTKVYHRNKTGNIQFLYDSYGCFDFFQELNQSTLNNNLQTQWGTADQIARWKPCRELVIKEIFSATEKLVFGYKTVFFSGANNSGMLQLTDPAVLRTDSMYSYKTVNSWTSSFANWARYRHIKAHNQNANFSNGTVDATVNTRPGLIKSAKGDWSVTQLPEVEGAFVAIDPLRGPDVHAEAAEVRRVGERPRHRHRHARRLLRAHQELRAAVVVRRVGDGVPHLPRHPRDPEGRRGREPERPRRRARARGRHRGPEARIRRLVVVGVVEGVDRQRLGQPTAQISGAYVVEPGEQLQTITHLGLSLAPGRPSAPGPAQWTVLPPRATQEAELARLDERIAKFSADPSADPGFVARLQSEREALAASLSTTPEGEAVAVFDQVKVTCKLPTDPDAGQRLTTYTAWVAKQNEAFFAGKRAPAPPAGTPGYAGIDECETCHEEAVAYWRTTVHAGAYQTLVDTNQQYDLACIACHVTGFREPGGSEVVENELLRAVQCEQCHGPGSAHVEDPVPETIVRAAPISVCLECHTPEHSDTFDYDAYLRDILGEGHGAPERAKLGAGPTGPPVSTSKRRAP